MYPNNKLSEKELLKDLIISEKQLVSTYNDAIIQSSSHNLRKIFSKCLLNAQDVQYSIYDSLNKRGWNNVDMVNEKKIENLLLKYDKKNV